MNKTSKKVSTLAATVAVATAFCGLCAGVATTVKAEAAPAPVQTSAANDYKVILNPGWNFESGTKKLNTIDDAGVKEMTQADKDKYYVENAYICTIPTGSPLPKPTAGRTGLTFNGWRYSKDGEVLTVSNVPAATSGNVFLYADWSASSTSSGGGGGGGGGGGNVTTGVTVNGTAMKKNDKPMEGVTEEYMLQGAKLDAGALEFNVNGSKATISELESASSGLTFSNGTVSVPRAGTYDLYLKKMSGKWVVYGARDVSQDETSIKGENAVAGVIYLAGTITDADFSWNNWNDINGHKGLKVTGGTLTVRLTKGDDCKFVKYSTNSNNMVWQKTLTGSGTHITFASNMKINDTGTYTFSVTESNGGLDVTVKSFTAG